MLVFDLWQIPPQSHSFQFLVLHLPPFPSTTSETHSPASVCHFVCSYHILPSSVVCYWTAIQQHGIYLNVKVLKILDIKTFLCNHRLESTQSIIIPELVELTNDEETSVRLAGLETITNLLNLLDDGRNLKKSLFYYRVVGNSQCNIFYIWRRPWTDRNKI